MTDEQSELSGDPPEPPRPRMSRRALGITAGAAVVGGVFATPLAVRLARKAGGSRTAPAGPPPPPSPPTRTPGQSPRASGRPTTSTQPSGSPSLVTRRKRSYALYPAWLRSADAHPQLLAEQPQGHTTLLLMGSSEFSSAVPQNPSTFLYNQAADFNLHYAGRAFCQSLYHAVQLAALADKLQHKKAALVVSAQWFVGEEPKLFNEVFSNSFYQGMLDSPVIRDSTKQALSIRIRELTGDPVWFPPSPVSAPYDTAVRRARVLREITQGEQSCVSFDGPWQTPPAGGPARSIDWTSALATATAQAKAAITDNPFNIADFYYKRNLAKAIDKLKGSQRHMDYSRDSTEWTDLDLLFQVARDAGIELLVLGIPMNGKWYDHLGQNAATRARYAERLKQVTQRAGMRYAEWFDREYDQGFLVDPSHLGWKGWLDVSRSLVDFAAP